jgi:hypothetical protein
VQPRYLFGTTLLESPSSRARQADDCVTTRGGDYLPGGIRAYDMQATQRLLHRRFAFEYRWLYLNPTWSAYVAPWDQVANWPMPAEVDNDDWTALTTQSDRLTA